MAVGIHPWLKLNNATVSTTTITEPFKARWLLYTPHTLTWRQIPENKTLQLTLKLLVKVKKKLKLSL
jgi:hypothetical protein